MPSMRIGRAMIADACFLLYDNGGRGGRFTALFRLPAAPSHRHQIRTTTVEVQRCRGISRLLASCSWPTVRYPATFLAYAMVVSLLSGLWLSFYFLRVLPVVQEYSNVEALPCNYDDTTYYVHMLLIYFMWFASTRALLMVPCLGGRVTTILLRRRSFFKAYAVHVLLRDGPLYVFLLHSLFFWLHVLQGPPCDKPDDGFQRVMKEYAGWGNLISLLCLVLANWHNKLLQSRAGAVTDGREGGSMGRAAPADTLHKLETLSYDEASFGDEETKPYPSECAICLARWEHDEAIKVTPCGHAFHEECITGWLRSASTCALCRRNLVVTSLEAPTPWTLGSPFGSILGSRGDSARAA
jgi:hypothetical protein